MALYMVKRLTSSFLLHRNCLQQLCQASKTSLPLIGSITTRYFSGGNDERKAPGVSKDEEKEMNLVDDNQDERDLPPSKTLKYKYFEKSEEELILDYQEEYMEQTMASDSPSDNVLFEYRERPDRFENFNLERGEDSVFDLEDLVKTLKMENMSDIAVIKIPQELKYCDYMVIASGKSFRHLAAVAAFIVKLWKLKKNEDDPFLKVEGEDCPDWKVFDMNSIVLHLFMPDTRERYDLESLWTLGAEFDDYTQRPAYDPVVDIMAKHMEYLQNLEPIASEPTAPTEEHSPQANPN